MPESEAPPRIWKPPPEPMRSGSEPRLVKWSRNGAPDCDPVATKLGGTSRQSNEPGKKSALIPSWITGLSFLFHWRSAILSHWRSTVYYPLSCRTEHHLLPELDLLWQRVSVVMEAYCAMETRRMDSGLALPMTSVGRRHKVTKLDLKQPRRIERRNSAPPITRKVPLPSLPNTFAFWRQSLDEATIAIAQGLVSLVVEISSRPEFEKMVGAEGVHPFVAEWNLLRLRFGEPSVSLRTLRDIERERFSFPAELLPLATIDQICRLVKVEARRLRQAFLLMECLRDSIMNRGWQFMKYRFQITAWSIQTNFLIETARQGGRGIEECLRQPPGQLWALMRRPKEPDLQTQQLTGQLLRAVMELSYQRSRIANATDTMKGTSTSSAGPIAALVDLRRSLDSYLSHVDVSATLVTANSTTSVRPVSPSEEVILMGGSLGGARSGVFSLHLPSVTVPPPQPPSGGVTRITDTSTHPSRCALDKTLPDGLSPPSPTPANATGVWVIGAEVEEATADENPIWRATADSDLYRHVGELPAFSVLTERMALPEILARRLAPPTTPVTGDPDTGEAPNEVEKPEDHPLPPTGCTSHSTLRSDRRNTTGTIGVIKEPAGDKDNLHEAKTTTSPARGESRAVAGYHPGDVQPPSVQAMTSPASRTALVSPSGGDSLIVGALRNSLLGDLQEAIGKPRE